MSERLRIGIVGCGGIANGKHLPSLKATLTRKPEAEEIPVQVNIQYVVEFYAR